MCDEHPRFRLRVRFHFHRLTVELYVVGEGNPRSRLGPDEDTLRYKRQIFGWDIQNETNPSNPHPLTVRLCSPVFSCDARLLRVSIRN